MRYTGKVGAPRGFVWHWVYDFLPRRFKDCYHCYFGKSAAHYCFIRKNEALAKTPATEPRQDIFTIARTSPRCYRVTWFDTATSECRYRSCTKATEVIDFVTDCWLDKNEIEDEFKRLQELEEVERLERQDLRREKGHRKL